MKMWGGRFTGSTDPDAWKFNASIEFDQRLGPQDVRGSIAWAKALERAGLLDGVELKVMVSGLKKILDEIEKGEFLIADSDEDIHSAVERRLEEQIGPLAGKLHTGRSRNDQVATDLRLWLLDYLPMLEESIKNLQTVLVERAEREIEIILPGYTHLQRAQPISLAHWWLSFFWPPTLLSTSISIARKRMQGPTTAPGSRSAWKAPTTFSFWAESSVPCS